MNFTRKSIFIVMVMCSLVATPLFAYVPSDPMYSRQDYLKQIGSESAWDIAKGKGVTVAVLDSGVDIDHPDLKFNIWSNSEEVADDGIDNDGNGFIDDINGWDFVSDSPSPKPKFEAGYNSYGMHHGTAISGIIAATANNSKGITGVAFESKIMPIRILSSDGTGNVSTLVRAIEYAVNNGADIINLSLVGHSPSPNLEEALAWAYNEDVLVVAASGNLENEESNLNLNESPTYPACYGNNNGDNIVLAVSSVNSLDVKPDFASYGSDCLDIVAPGENLVSLSFHDDDHKDFQGYYAYTWSGTSVSTALVSGAAALVKSYNKSLSPDQVISALVNNAEVIDDLNEAYRDQLGSGRLDLAASMEAMTDFSQGYIAKLANNPAVYYIDAKNTRHLFPNEVTYWTWYRGSWADQRVQIISRSYFDDLKIGANVTARPGTGLVQFDNSQKVFVVLPGSALRSFENDEALVRLYGENWEDRAITIQTAFETDYRRDSEFKMTIESNYPSGSLLQYDDFSTLWYVDGSVRRRVSTKAFIANGFKDESVIRDISSDFVYVEGDPMDGYESRIFVYNK
jgi:hypothetical protein